MIAIPPYQQYFFARLGDPKTPEKVAEAVEVLATVGKGLKRVSQPSLLRIVPLAEAEDLTAIVDGSENREYEANLAARFNPNDYS